MDDTQLFIDSVVEFALRNKDVVGVALAGSHITGETDEYSDIDFVIVLNNGIRFDRKEMESFALNFGALLSCFTGEHVGESRLLVCLYEKPLLHVDFKFIQIAELQNRVEDPIFIYNNNQEINTNLTSHQPHWPTPDYQWIEDRFWVWIHYAGTKIGRGEFYEAIDLLSFIRSRVLGPLLHIKYNLKPVGVRKLEFIIDPVENEMLKATLPSYDFHSIKDCILASIDLYQQLKRLLFGPGIESRKRAEYFAIQYINSLKKE